MSHCPSHRQADRHHHPRFVGRGRRMGGRDSGVSSCGVEHTREASTAGYRNAPTSVVAVVDRLTESANITTMRLPGCERMSVTSHRNIMRPGTGITRIRNRATAGNVRV